MRDDEDPHARIGEMLRIGTVESIDHAGGRVVVAVGDIRTSGVRWLERRAGATRSYSPPSVGEQVILLCPEGDIEGAIALGGLTQNAFPLPGNSARELLSFADGSSIGFDPDSATFDLMLSSGSTLNVTAATVNLVASDGINITGNVQVDGKVDVTGAIVAVGEIKSGAISLTGHKHLGVAAGSAKTGAAE